MVDDDRPLLLGGPKQRALLAVLLLPRGEVVSTDRLIDELWGERPPASAAKTVQVYISNLRKALGDGLLVTRGRGYMLEAERGQLDVDRVDALATGGREALQQVMPSARAAGCGSRWRYGGAQHWRTSRTSRSRKARLPGSRKSASRRSRIESTLTSRLLGTPR